VRVPTTCSRVDNVDVVGIPELSVLEQEQPIAVILDITEVIFYVFVGGRKKVYLASDGSAGAGEELEKLVEREVHEAL
jgi:hypothetical protein